MPPTKAETIIVGGGIIGASIAYFLAQAGARDVLLLEKESLASGATGVCPGGIRQQFAGEADCRLARASMGFWRRINEELRPDEPFVFERSGYLFLADSDDLLERFRANVRLQNRLGIPSRIVTPAEIGLLVPALRLQGVAGGSWCAEDGFLEDCHGVTAQLARRAGDSGVTVLFEEAGEIRPISGGWRLRAGEREVSCRRLVLAAGADTPSLGASFGLRLPIRPVRRRLAFTEALPEQLLPPLVVAPERGFAGKQLAYGVFYLGWLGETGEEEELDFLERGLAAGASLLPLLAELPVRRVLSGVYDQSPDSRPILGGVEGCQGLYLAAGFSGHGFMIAPAVGQAIAALITGEADPDTLAPFSLQRFRVPTRPEDLTI